MGGVRQLLLREVSQYTAFLGLSIGALALTGVGYASNNLLFSRFLGRINPLVAVGVASLLGAILLSLLLARGWFAIYRRVNPEGLLRYFGLAVLLAAVAILLDLKIVFPADQNILFPASLLFYPAIGFLVEILFHVLPLSLLLLLLTSVFKSARYGTIVLISILAVSLLEALYQAADLGSSGVYPEWAVLYVGFHVFLFNCLQLKVFQRYDFISMLSCRLVYYLIWHIVWGYVRLRLLF